MSTNFLNLAGSLVISFPHKPKRWARLEKLFLRSFPDFPAPFQENDSVGMFDRRETVGNQNLSHLALQSFYGELDAALADRIQRRGRLVHD